MLRSCKVKILIISSCIYIFLNDIKALINYGLSVVIGREEYEKLNFVTQPNLT